MKPFWGFLGALLLVVVGGYSLLMVSVGWNTASNPAPQLTRADSLMVDSLKTRNKTLEMLFRNTNNEVDSDRRIWRFQEDQYHARDAAIEVEVKSAFRRGYEEGYGDGRKDTR